MTISVQTVTDSQMNEFVRIVANAMEEHLGCLEIDRFGLNECLEETLLEGYGIRVVADPPYTKAEVPWRVWGALSMDETWEIVEKYHDTMSASTMSGQLWRKVDNHWESRSK